MKMICSKCGREMELDTRASSPTRKIWICLWDDCKEFKQVLVLNKDDLITQLQAELDERIEQEAMVCPEDVSFVEYTKVLQTKNKQLQAELKQIHEQKACGDRILQLAELDMGKLQAEKETLEAENEKLKENNEKLKFISNFAWTDDCCCEDHTIERMGNEIIRLQAELDTAKGALKVIKQPKIEGYCYTSEKAAEKAHKEALLKWLNENTEESTTHLGGTFYVLMVNVADQALREQEKESG